MLFLKIKIYTYLISYGRFVLILLLYTYSQQDLYAFGKYYINIYMFNMHIYILYLKCNKKIFPQKYHKILTPNIKSLNPRKNMHL